MSGTRGASGGGVSAVDGWVAEAAALPVAFAQVREDARLDLEALALAAPGGEARVLTVASGGCTAAALAASVRVAALHLVDVNPAQLALSRFKLALLSECEPAERAAVLGHAPLDTAVRGARVRSVLAALELPPDALGPFEQVARQGPDHMGRYERVFAALRAELAPEREALDHLLGLDDPARQERLAAPGTALGRCLDGAFARVMSLPNLLALFGPGASQGTAEPFSSHFARRTRHALATLPARDNPYLWQVLAGRFPEEARVPWLDAPRPVRMPELTWTRAPFGEAAREGGGYDLVHISNILDWLPPGEAAALLERASAALRPGGWLLARQLNSTLDVPALPSPIHWDAERGRRMARTDRSYFYRAIHLGRRP